MYAITFPGSIAGMAVYLFRQNANGRTWHRAEHIVRVFRHRIDAENALREYTDWVKRETVYTPPECNNYLLNRLKQAAIVMSHDIPEKTKSGYDFILQTSDDQDLSLTSGGYLK